MLVAENIAIGQQLAISANGQDTPPRILCQAVSIANRSDRVQIEPLRAQTSYTGRARRLT